MSAVETLREAVKVLRERAAVPYGLPWTPDGTGGVNTAADLEDDRAGPTIYVNGGLYANQNKTAAYIATMHPSVALALADWLDDLADHDPSPLMPTEAGAFKVADAVLGGGQR